MREILFRGKNKLGVWVYGIPILSSINTEKEKVIIVDEYADNLNVEMCVTMDTIGQFTGLTDKNGVKIFEGDILEQESFFGYPIRHVVGWSEENALFTAKLMQDDFPTSRIAQYWVSKKAVIGNIHDNPELLKGGEE